VKEPAEKRRDTLLKAAKTARLRCRGKEEKMLCIVSIFMLIDTVKDTIEAIGET